VKPIILIASFLSFINFSSHIKAVPFCYNPDNLILQPKDTVLTPEQVVQGQLEAYNLKDLEAFLSFYSDDIKAFNFPEREIFSGKNAMRRGYESFFTENPGAQCEVQQRMIMGNTIIDHEKIFNLAKGNILEAMVIFKIEKGKIHRIYFIRP
jgi:hypothetical protein